MKCGKCLLEFKSYLRLQYHKAKEHGEKNQTSHLSSIQEYNSPTDRKDRLAEAEERLKDEISRWRYYNS